jgi:hypothetical protein
MDDHFYHEPLNGDEYLLASTFMTSIFQGFYLDLTCAKSIAMPNQIEDYSRTVR